MGTSEALSDLLDKKTRVNLVNGDVIEGELRRADAIGALLAPDRRLTATVAGPTDAQKPEDGLPAYCFIPWSQIRMITPAPDETGPQAPG